MRKPLQSPCEVAAREVMPSIRASIAYVLTTEMGLSKYEAARLLGLTPAAISNYLERKRGDKYFDQIVKDPRSMAMVKEAAGLVLAAWFDERASQQFQYITCAICSGINEAAKRYGCHFLRSLGPAEGLKH
ncbi:MAG: putative transcriptional regulator [uncultured Acidilobus sp. CIS]|nr:MAG: putative transcriptional regulator [uncultured Acidilobus sp. CIS]